jgi:hypothetical protein
MQQPKLEIPEKPAMVSSNDTPSLGSNLGIVKLTALQ